MAVCLFLKGPFDNIGQSVDVMCDAKSYSTSVSYILLSDSSMEATSKSRHKGGAHVRPFPDVE